MATKYNHLGANHALSKKGVKNAEEILELFGNRPFEPKDAGYTENEIQELKDNGFLRYHSGASVFHCGKQVIGKVPTRRSKAA